MQRFIMHIDMDAFFASVEQLDHPEWRGRPVVVGHGDRGVVSAASYEARKYGIHSAMSVYEAKKRCPHAIFTPGSRHRYSEISSKMMCALRSFSPIVEQASIDEAYLDVTGSENLFSGILEMGYAVKAGVKKETGLNCSVGLAPVKFLAKIASDFQKPNGLTIITQDEVHNFLEVLPLGKIPGLGKKTLAKVLSYGIKTAGDGARLGQEFWVSRFGKSGQVLYDRCCGVDLREVIPYTAPKSESAENTFLKDTLDFDELSMWLLKQSERIAANIRRQKFKGRTVTLKVKYSDFSQITRSHSLNSPTDSTKIIYEVACALLRELNPDRLIRLIGVGISGFDENFTPDIEQAILPGIDGFTGKRDKFFPENVDIKKEKALDKTLDALRDKFGKGAIVRGKLFNLSKE